MSFLEQEELLQVLRDQNNRANLAIQVSLCIFNPVNDQRLDSVARAYNHWMHHFSIVSFLHSLFSQ